MMLSSNTGGNFSDTNSKGGQQNGKARRNASLPVSTVNYLKKWLLSPEHIAHPYPTENEKLQIMKETGITLKQLTNWFVNNRKRLWKPRIEQRLQEHAQAANLAAQARAAALTAVSLAQNRVAVQQQQQQQQTPIQLLSPSNPVTPEPAYKQTMTIPSPSENEVVAFDLESSNNINDSEHPSQDDFVTNNAIASIALQLLLAKPLSIAAPPMCCASVSASEGEMSDSAPDCLSGMDVVSSPLQTCHDAASSEMENTIYARNVSFCSSDLSSEEENVAFAAAAAASSATTHGTASSMTLAPTSPTVTKTCHKRPATTETVPSPAIVTPRKKSRRVSLDKWIDACSNASKIDDDSLPSLEEASRLFGYSQ